MNIETLAKDEFIKSTIEKNFLNEKIFILAFEQGYKTGYSNAQPEMYTIIAFKEDLINNKGLSD